MSLWSVSRRSGQALVLALFTALSPARAAPIEDSLVYIECTDDEGNVVSRGSGVLVSANGRVLTAGYVIPKQFEQNCRGSLTVADTNDAKKLIPQPDSTNNVVRILIFQVGNFTFVPYCPLPSHAVRAPVVAAGFPGNTRSGSPSFRGGMLSTIVPDDRGLIETDVLTGSGMGGGPVFSSNLAGIVGLVAGAEFDASGSASSYLIQPLENLAAVLNLTASTTPCFPSVDAMTRIDAMETRINELEKLIREMGIPGQ